MGDQMKEISCRAEKMVVRHWNTGEEIISQSTGTDADIPSLIGHRGYTLFDTRLIQGLPCDYVQSGQEDGSRYQNGGTSREV